jgi:hypothetical protein
MTDSHDAHEVHADHPVSASVVGLILVAVFVGLFALLNDSTFDAMVAVVAILLTGWTLFVLWALDRD